MDNTTDIIRKETAWRIIADLNLKDDDLDRIVAILKGHDKAIEKNKGE